MQRKSTRWGGWRDVKLGIFSKRLLGDKALPKDYSKRKLPDFSVRAAFAAIEKKDCFRRRLSGWRKRLRPGWTGDISALADGAAWIWDVVRSEFGKVRECLDVYHALSIGAASVSCYMARSRRRTRSGMRRRRGICCRTDTRG